MAGFYYLNATALTQFDVRLFTTVSGLTAYTDAKIVTDTMAGFVNMTYDLTDHIGLEAGGRYTWDKRGATILRQNYLGGGSPTFGGAGIAFGAPSTNFMGAPPTPNSPRASINWRPECDNTIYVSYSQGFKGGGFDPRGVGVNAPAGMTQGEFLSFRPEKVNNYEVGVKTRLFDRKLGLNLAAFRMDYTDVQIPGSVACTVSGLPSFCGVVSNAGKADAGCGGRGAFQAGRADAQWLAGLYRCQISEIHHADQWLAHRCGGLSQGAEHARMERQCLGDGGAAGAQGVAGPDGGMSWKSTTYQFEVPNPYLDQPAYALFDASLVYRAPGPLDAGRLRQEPGRQALQDLGLHLCGGERDDGGADL
jgi:iron complex outermembrane receptor protein